MATKTATATATATETNETVTLKTSTAPTVKPFFKKAEVEEFDAYDTSSSNWFIAAHQYEDYDEETETVSEYSPLSPATLGSVLDAFTRSESLMEQFPLNPRTVKEVSHSLFVKHEQLRQPIVLAVLTADDDKFKAGTYFGIGGRHRSHAIVEFINEYLRDSESRTKVLSDTEVAVIVRPVSSVEVLKEYILADNSSRNMPPAEKVHMNAQANLGLKSRGATAADFGVVLNNEELKKGDRSNYLGLLFARLQPKGLGLKTNTAMQIGKSLFTALSDFEQDSISQTGTIYAAIAKDAWAYFKLSIGEYDNVARSVTDIVLGYVDSETLADKIQAGAYVAKKTVGSKKAAAAAAAAATPAE